MPGVTADPGPTRQAYCVRSPDKIKQELCAKVIPAIEKFSPNLAITVLTEKEIHDNPSLILQ